MQSTAVQTPAPCSRDEVVAHLQQILSDRRFASADRMAAFLRYVVERTLEGKSDEIKETVIAADVYGRARHYDPKTDSIVRVEASRLRQKLRSYYENEGRSASLRILLPSGSYVPRFETVMLELPADEAAVTQPDSLAAAPPASGRPFWFALSGMFSALALAAAVLTAGVFGISGRRETPHPEAAAALKESIELLAQDPHSARTERGAPATALRAIERLEFAVAKDPEHAAAWARLAESYDYVFPYVDRDPREDARRAEAAARRAVTLDPSSSEAHQMLGLVLAGMRWDYPSAERSYRRALELNPSNSYAAIEYADLLRATGRTAGAEDVIRRARALNPGLAQVAAKEAEILLDLGRADAAIAAAKQALGFRQDYHRGYVTMGMAEELKGEYGSALKRYEYVLSFDPMERRALPAYGFLLGRMGRTEQARQVAQTLERMNATIRNCAYQTAVVYAGLGDNQHTLEWLERAWRSHQALFPFLRVDGRFRHLREDPRYRELFRRADAAAGVQH